MASSNGYYPITGIQDGLEPLDPKKDQTLRKVRVRMEIDDWYTSTNLLHLNQRALFFPAFWKFSQMAPKEKLSYFQIAGIHGKPFVAWDEPPQKGTESNKGYCTHNSVLFCTWHRAYVLLYEQVIFELMQEEIKNYATSERGPLEEAARAWRLPYWDWAMKKKLPENPQKRDYNVPLVVLEKDVHIRLPTGSGQGTCRNAFYQFTMPKGIAMGDESLANADLYQDLRITPSAEKYQPDAKKEIYWDVLIRFDRCQGTSRHPAESGITANWEHGIQNNAAIAKDLRDYKWDKVNNTEDPKKGNLTASLRDAFYRLTTIENFEDFASMRAPGGEFTKDYAFDSSENLHNNMHDWCGGPLTKPDPNWASQMGHMAHVPVAAFDPIFWLHHSNVDRLFAIWQFLHEKSWFDGKDERDKDMGTFGIKKDNRDTPQDSLRPFRKNSSGDYWTSADVREVTALGYTYPGLEKWNHVKDNRYDRDGHMKDLNTFLNESYNSSGAAAQKARLTDDHDQSDGIKLASMASLTALTKQDPVDLEIDDYVVNVIYEKFALGGASFTIHLFIGKVPDEPPYTSEDGKTYVGEVFNFSTEPGNLGNSPSGCQNCRSQQNDHNESTGRVALTNALITRFKNGIEHEPHDSQSVGLEKLASMEPKDVVPFLKANFHWRVTSMGALVDPERIPSVKVSVAVGRASHYADPSKLSRFHDYKGAYEITQDRPNGAGPDDRMYPPEDVYRSGT